MSPDHCAQPAHPRHLPRGDGLHLAAVRRHDGARDAVLQHGDQPLYCTVLYIVHCTVQVTSPLTRTTTCTILWPLDTGDSVLNSQTLFTVYSFILGFAGTP